MNTHILHRGKILCGRIRILCKSVPFEQARKATCLMCMQKYGEISYPQVISPVPSRFGKATEPTTYTPVAPASPSYDPTFDILSPLNPVSPFSPLHHSDPEPSHHSPSHDPTPHHDHSPSHDPAPSHDSSGGGYDTGGGFDSGSSSSDSGGGATGDF